MGWTIAFVVCFFSAVAFAGETPALKGVEVDWSLGPATYLSSDMYDIEGGSGYNLSANVSTAAAQARWVDFTLACSFSEFHLSKYFSYPAEGRPALDVGRSTGIYLVNVGVGVLVRLVREGRFRWNILAGPSWGRLNSQGSDKPINTRGVSYGTHLDFGGKTTFFRIGYFRETSTMDEMYWPYSDDLRLDSQVDRVTIGIGFSYL